jgi:Tfp pilus assembly protein PilX
MRSRQKGAALMMALVILLIMTLIGLSALQTSTLDMKIVANLKENVAAYHNSETGLEVALADDADLPFLDPASFNVSLSGTDLGGECANINVTLASAEDISSGTETLWGETLEPMSENDDVNPGAINTSAHAASGKDWVLTSVAERCSKAKATHRQAVQSVGAGT